jgi:drug/metabolite transporter (DMT)-like permease
MAVVLALVSALAYGLSDFIGGLVSRRTSAWSVAVVGSLTAAACTAAVAAFVPGDPGLADVAWAVLAGLGSGAGAGFLYRGFAAGRMGVVAPVSAVGAAVVPLLVGVVSGERPALLAWVGIAAALPGIWLVSREPVPDDAAAQDSGQRSATAAGVVDGLLAGLGFGVLFAALGQIPDSAGLWPLALTQLLSVPAVVIIAGLLHEPWLPRHRAAWHAVWCGLLSTIATATFLFATQRGFLTISGVLASLYPAFTILLAAVVLKEHIHRAQAVGLALCGGAVALVAAG